jgi:hypothetical protein
MNEEEFKKLKEDIKKYKELRNDVLKKIEEIKQEFREGKKFPWHVEYISLVLYEELSQSDSRIKFVEYAKIAKNNSEFEKFFRAAFLEIFFGIIVDPSCL